jgi:hypothetical protein
MDTSFSLQDTIQNQDIQKTTVALNYSRKTRADIIKAVALFAISLVGFVSYVAIIKGPVSYSRPTLFGLVLAIASFAIVLGIAGGGYKANQAAQNHANEIAERELDFAERSDKSNMQLQSHLSIPQYGSVEITSEI